MKVTELKCKCSSQGAHVHEVLDGQPALGAVGRDVHHVRRLVDVLPALEQEHAQLRAQGYYILVYEYVEWYTEFRSEQMAL